MTPSPKMKGPTISGLKASLRAANEECEQYIQAKAFLVEDVKRLEAEVKKLKQFETVASVLFVVVQDYQTMLRKMIKS